MMSKIFIDLKNVKILINYSLCKIPQKSYIICELKKEFSFHYEYLLKYIVNYYKLFYFYN